MRKIAAKGPRKFAKAKRQRGGRGRRNNADDIGSMHYGTELKKLYHLPFSCNI